MQPSTAPRSNEWACWARHEAGAPTPHAGNGSCVVVTREWTIEQNLSLGTETYIPSRLMQGLVPEALLTERAYYMAEDNDLRGYPSPNSTSNDIILVTIAPGGHPALHGTGAEGVRPDVDGSSSLLPTRSMVLRLKQRRLVKERDSVRVALASLERWFNGRAGLLSSPFTVTFALARAVASFIRRTDISMTLEEAIEGIDTTRLWELDATRRQGTALPLQAINAASKVASAHTMTAADAGMQEVGHLPQEAPARAAASIADFESSELVLMDLLHPPAGSYLYSLATVLGRMENLSHILAWAKFDETIDLTAPEAFVPSDVWIVSCPRLKMSFEHRNGRRA